MTGHEIRAADPFAETIRLLATRWKGAARILPGFALLAEGNPVPRDRLAEACGLGDGELEETLGAVSCERDGQGRLIGLYGLTLAPTRHRLRFDDAVVYSCCALWAHVIPVIVGRTALVDSLDPIDGKRVRLAISPDGIVSLKPGSAVATMAIATEEDVRTDVGAAFCSQVLHFGSPRNAKRFARERPDRHVIEIGTLNATGHRLWKAIRAGWGA